MWHKEAKKIPARDKSSDGNQKISEVGGTSDKESPFF